MYLRTEESCTYVQCQHCVKVYQVYRQYPSETLFIDSWCPECDMESKALVLGERKEDIYAEMNINLDERCYIYN